MRDLSRLRAWWYHRQGLDGSLRGATPAEVLARTGWARSVGGCGPYLGLFARAQLARETVDAAVAALEIHELPSARGCAYVLPARDFALGLRVAAAAPETEIAAARKHLGVGETEVDEVCAAVLEALDAAEGPLDPAALRAATGGAVRDLGEAGRKRGTATTLTLALGLLQVRGAIRRVPANGRLDQQRYGYVRWGLDLGAYSDEQARVELARRYFDWAAPASLQHFRWFSGLTVAAARAALAELDLRPVGGDGGVGDGAVGGEGAGGDGAGAELLLPADLVEVYENFEPPRGPVYALVAGVDGIHLLHRDFPRLMDPGVAERPAPGDLQGRPLGALADPPTHLILDRGRLVGLWEYDTVDRGIVWHAFGREDAALGHAIAATAAFVREQLGDARSYSLDSPKSREPRVAALRQR
ncbi:DNA glycosylase AlkZ-like family protein [Streptomyces sp. URMC 123]|uniref:DNA glycosylase AlkZ-like family protein n=1 Tax=Streptomyces sp. URMC 123 TaxID=3423403 RepID=UPI003F1BC652